MPQIFGEGADLLFFHLANGSTDSYHKIRIMMRLSVAFAK